MNRIATVSVEIPTFTKLLDRAGRWDAEFLEMESAPAQCFDLGEDALIFDNSSIQMDQDARNRLFRQTGAPVTYLAQPTIRHSNSSAARTQTTTQLTAISRLLNR